MSCVAGIDACRRGWIAVILRSDAAASARFLPTIAAIGTVAPDVEAIAIDIPIGLVEDGPRPCDVLVKRELGPRRSSLFLTPVRPALEAPTYAEANALARRSTGAGISRQAYGLAAKILEVERWLPDAPCDVWEVHPELSFRMLMGRPPASKKTWLGMTERRDAVAAAGIELTDVDRDAGVQGAVDDVLDAAVAAWSAQRLLAGTARSWPDPRVVDPVLGRSIAIWA